MGYWPWSTTRSPTPPLPTTQPIQITNSLIGKVDAQLKVIPPSTLVLCAFAFGSVSTVGSTFIYRRFFKRIINSDGVTSDMIAKKRWLKGRVVSVGDNDNFRLYHTPGIGWNWPLKFRHIPTARKALTDQTIHIRMAGVDAPEGAHFGRPAQPFSEEALAWLKSQVEGKTVYCQVLRKDQYGRIVAVPCLKPRFLPGFLATGKCVSIEMLRAGWAMVYEQAGAEYGDRTKEEMLAIQHQAQNAKLGMWKKGTKGETPAEYKRRYASASPDVEVQAPTNQGQSNSNSKRPFWKRIL